MWWALGWSKRSRKLSGDVTSGPGDCKLYRHGSPSAGWESVLETDRQSLLLWASSPQRTFTCFISFRGVVITEFLVKPRFMWAGRHSVSLLWTCDVLIKTGLLLEAAPPHCQSLQDTVSSQRKCSPGSLPRLLTHSSGTAYFVMIQVELIKSYMGSQQQSAKSQQKSL